MNYPGNASLPPAVRDRVTSTFQQAVALFKSGRMDEVAAGCNLILQMDPSFEPARRLMDASRNPGLPIDVDSLIPSGEGGAMEQARQAMAERDFQRVIHLTTEVLTNDLLNDEARILGDQAREKMEAGPFIDQFARKCDDHLSSGRISAAKADLEKARSLDPTHPEVIRISREIAAREMAPPPAPAPSFVVDDLATPGVGRTTAQASDFGFTFEEEKPSEVSFSNFSFDEPAPASSGFGGFSFDEPAPPAAKEPVSGDFDFSSASVTTSDDDRKKIQRYLEEGDRAWDSGDAQQAIDIWSRIFLIDVTHEEASERIERAKAKRREIERRVEPLLTEGIEAFDRSDTARAHTAFSEILRIDPGNAMAQDYLDRLGETVEGGATGATSTFVPPAEEPRLDLDFLDEPRSSGSETPLIPPPPAKAEPKPAEKKKAAAKSSGRKLPLGAIAAVVGVLLLGAGGWFAWSAFSGGGEEEPAAARAIFNRATSLANSGKYDEAIALLQDIQPGDPDHDRALGMIADLQQKKSAAAQVIDGKPATQYAAERLAAATAAFQAHDYSAAKLAFEQAMRVSPLTPEAKAQFDIATQQVANLEAARALFRERKYSEAISNLEPLMAQNPENQNIRRLIVDAHFNLGATALQEERIPDAIREFDQVLALSPEDELAKRSRTLAARYAEEKKDLLYRIYVKYLPLRQAT